MAEKKLWVDISKGIVICLMVIGHSSIPNFLSRWIWSFHMPFFFFISALFTSWGKHSIREFALRKGKILILPFLVYSIINWFFFPYSLHITHSDYAKEIILNGWEGIALWFVPVFYIASLICKICTFRNLIFFGFAALTIGTILSHFFIILPWTISSIPFAVSIMMFTRRFASSIKNNLIKLTHFQLASLVFLGGILSLWISHYWRLDMACNNITPIIPICLGIIGGISVIVATSILLEKVLFINKILQSIGKNTYEIMALSQVIIASLKIEIESALIRYTLMVLIIICAVYLRKIIEGKFSKIEAI